MAMDRSDRPERPNRDRRPRRKVCAFCADKIEMIDYKDVPRLRRYLSERGKIVEAAEYLKNNPNDKLLIEGYCDWRGTREYNLTLGDRRASGVKQYLLDQGVSPDRVQTLSNGDLKAEENASASAMKEDRRAGLVVIR